MAHITDNKPAFGHPLFHLADALVGLRRRSREKKGLTTLSGSDDHALRELGMTRDQVQDVLQARSSQDAADALRRLSLERRAPWM